MRRVMTLFCCAGLLLTAGIASANTIESSTMWFQGSLTYDASDGSYTGTIPMVAGYYYVPGGGGAGISTGGGFDVYAKEGGNAYYDSAFQGVIGSDHDAYSHAGGWGSVYDPDCADYYNYSLKLSSTGWSLHHKGGGTQLLPTGGRPMAGSMDWTTMIARETDTGAYDPGPGSPKDPGWAAANGGGPGAWDMDWSWGSEVIPLQYDGFIVGVRDLGGGEYEVSLTPTPEPATMLLLGGTLLGGLGLRRRRRRRA